MADQLHFLYTVTARDIAPFKANSRLAVKDRLQHGVPTIAASYSANNSDGRIGEGIAYYNINNM